MVLKRRFLLPLCFIAVHIVTVLATPTDPRDVNTEAWSQYYLSLQDFSSTNYTVTKGARDSSNNLVAIGKYNASKHSLGWDYLEIQAGPEMFHGGVLEGYLTAQAISDRYQGNLSKFSSLDGKVQQWVQQQWDWLSEQVAASQHKYSLYWRQIGRLMAQVEGLSVGFNLAVKKGNVKNFLGPMNVTKVDMFTINLGNEMSDIQLAVKVQAGELEGGQLLNQSSVTPTHCSGFIRPTADDLLVGHTTWDRFYPSLNYRMFKRYVVGQLAIPVPGGSQSSNVPLPGVVIQFSSYPALIASGDDWYQVSQLTTADSRGSQHWNNLAVMETSNYIWNTTLYLKVLPNSVSEFMRVMVANYLATGGEEWTTMFSRHNSGTYNNQYMVVDFNKYAPGNTISPGTLWIAEQIPGYLASRDVSAILQQQGYWASYNIPFDKHIYNVSGYAHMQATQGSYWSYNKYVRPEIFKRNHTMVQDVASMMRLMRYNNFNADPLSLIPNCTGATNNTCSPKHAATLAIASRGDLDKVYSTDAENMAHYGILHWGIAKGCAGGIDTKIATYKNRFTLQSYVVNGPTNDQQPTFSWASSSCPSPGNDLNAITGLFDFPWVNFIPALPWSS